MHVAGVLNTKADEGKNLIQLALAQCEQLGPVASSRVV
jgi:hypothetical protein